MTSDSIFLKYSADKLIQQTERIGACLDQLNAEQIWARGAEKSNAVGNLVLHLCGNVTQWIGAGVGGREDTRQRDAEFAARGDVTPAELKDRLTAAVDDVAMIIRELPAERLIEKVQIQKYNVSVLEAIYHVVEHFSAHTGQIIFATKLLTSTDLGFYNHLSAAQHSERVP